MTEQLDALSQLGSGQPWRPPEQLRRTAAQRRRRARAAVAGTAGAAVVALVLTLVQVNSGPGSSPVQVAAGLHAGDRSGPALQLVANVSPLPDASASASTSAAAVAQAEQEFALALLRQTNATGSTGNVALSPSSLSIALAMLQNGATGETRAQIAKVLQTTALTNDQQDAGWASLTADLTAAAKQGYTLESANSLWLQQNLPMQPAFMAAMAQYFHAGVWQVDFAHNLSGATKALNGWVKKQTDGKIAKLFRNGDIDDSTAMVLANALYFKAKWQYAFDPKLTSDQSFTLADGTHERVPFMSMETYGMKIGGSRYDEKEYVAAQLPYQGDRLSALLIMPKTGPLTTFVDDLSATKLHRITSSLSSGGDYQLDVPKFHVEQYLNLNRTLSALGMPKAFTPTAEFPALSPEPLQVQSAAQRVYLNVEEGGTEAAAATGLGIAASAAPPSLSFDHPFLFLIRDTVTGTILFSAEVQNPAS